MPMYFVRDCRCSNDSICGTDIRLTHIRLDPYGESFIEELLQTCCGSCVKINVVNVVEKVCTPFFKVKHERGFLIFEVRIKQI